MHFRSHYFDDPKAKAAFKVFAREIFGLDFTPWEARGLWDQAYRPYSIFDGGAVVANICVYPSLMTVEGIVRNGLELLTVGTLPAYRRQGLQRQIWQIMAEEEVPRHDFVFLFTESAAGFYEKLGLRKQREFFHRLSLERPASGPAPKSRKLDPDNPEDFVQLRTLAHERAPVSQRIGFQNPRLLLFMLIAPCRDWLHYLPDLNILAVIEPLADRIRVHDLIGPSMPPLSAFEPFLARFDRPAVDFLFPTDQLGPIETEAHLLIEDTLMTSPDFAMPGRTLFPFTIRA